MVSCVAMSCRNAKGVKIENHLRAAHTVGVSMPQLDWVKMDYSDLVSIEAFRQYRFENSVARELANINEHHANSQDRLTVLRSLLGDQVQIDEVGRAVMSDANCLVEYLQQESGDVASEVRARWLAYSIWLDLNGVSLAMVLTDGTWRCALAEAVPPMSEQRLAAWIENLM